MKNLNKKGFTLVELLAVIVILGVIMLIAIPSVGAIIKNSRENSFISSGQMYVSTMQNIITGEMLDSNNKIYCISVKNLVDKDGSGAVKYNKSPINPSEDIHGYVLYDANNSTYKAYISDKTNDANGITATSKRTDSGLLTKTEDTTYKYEDCTKANTDLPASATKYDVTLDK